MGRDIPREQAVQNGAPNTHFDARSRLSMERVVVAI